MSSTFTSKYPPRSNTRLAASRMLRRVRSPLALPRSEWAARRAAAVPTGVHPPRVLGPSPSVRRGRFRRGVGLSSKLGIDPFLRVALTTLAAVGGFDIDVEP